MLGERGFENLDMHFAEPLDFFDGHAALDQRLLHGRDFRGAHSLDQLREFSLYLARRASGVQSAYDFLEFYLSFGIDGGVVGHAFLL